MVINLQNERLIILKSRMNRINTSLYRFCAVDSTVNSAINSMANKKMVLLFYLKFH
jgi:hypothetical protein